MADQGLPWRVLVQDLNIMQANAWVYWQAIENSENGNWWGLMQVRASWLAVSIALLRDKNFCT